MILGMVFLSGGLHKDLVDPKCDPTEDTEAWTAAQCQYRRSCLTKIYNVFFFLQLFNEINCRKVGNKDFDVFENFFHNPWYSLVLLELPQLTSDSNYTFQTYLSTKQWTGASGADALPQDQQQSL